MPVHQHNPNNERIKREYLRRLKEAKQQSDATVHAVAKSLARFEESTGWLDFKRFHREQAIRFKQKLAEQDSLSTGEKLSHSTRYKTLADLKRFFEWLALHPGYKSRIHCSDAEYFNLSEKEVRIAKAPARPRPCPAVEQVHELIRAMPAGSEVEQRNRALVAFTLLTGARDGAIASFNLEHVDLEHGCVHQDARKVKTKFSKTFSTWFFPVGGEARRIFYDWVAYLRRDKLWLDEDPLFPATRVAVSADRKFEAAGLSKDHWSDAAPIRAIFREASRLAQLPYFNPHSLRKTLARLGEQVCQTPEQLKAWSQNLGHESVLTTLRSYGEVPWARQGEIIRTLTAGPKASGDGRAAKTLARVLSMLEEEARRAAAPGGSSVP